MAETQHLKARAKLALMGHYIPKGKVTHTVQQSKFRDGADWPALLDGQGPGYTD